MFDFDRAQLDKLEQLRELGIEPYPNNFEINDTVNNVRTFGEEQSFSVLESLEQEFTIAGRLRFKNEMGKLGFGRIEDQFGRIQIGIRKNEVPPESFLVWKKLDVGDVRHATLQNVAEYNF